MERSKGLRKAKGGVQIAGETRVPVEWADGETRYIRYNMRAIGTLENCYPGRDENGNFTGNPSTPVAKILSWIDPKFGMSWELIENFLWVGLLHDYPDITKDDLEDMIDPAKVNYYDQKIGEALKVGLGGKQLEDMEKGEEVAEGDAGKKD